VKPARCDDQTNRLTRHGQIRQAPLIATVDSF
jgi:hypothetical protein